MAKRIGRGGPFLQPLPAAGDAPPPFANYDDAVPRQRRSQAGAVEVTVNLLLTTLAAVTVLRAPTFERSHYFREPQGFETPNLLLTTLALQYQPFAIEWDDRPPRQVSRLDVDQRNLALMAGAPAAAPFVPEDFPDLRRRALSKADHDQRNLPISLVGAPFAQYDWPSALRIAPHAAEQHQNLLATTLAPAQGIPFSQTDWLGRQRVRPVPAWEPPLNLPIAQVGAPFVPEDYPAPRAVRRVAFEERANLLETTLAPVGAVPFVPHDWPVRQRVVFRAAAEPSAPPIALISAPPAAQPFRPIDWGGAQARMRQRQEDYSNLLTTTLSQIVPGVFPADSPVHFRSRPGAVRLGEATEKPQTARLGEATEKPEVERLGSSDAKPPVRGPGAET